MAFEPLLEKYKNARKKQTLSQKAKKLRDSSGFSQNR